MDLLAPVQLILTPGVLATGLVVAGIMQAIKIGLRSASDRLRGHALTKVGLALTPMALGALGGWLFLGGGDVHPVALGMVAGLLSTTIYGAIKGLVGKDRLELRGGS